MKLIENQHIIIIGSGMAGYLLAQSIRQQSKLAKITLITERDGRFYPKPMLSTAIYHKKTPASIETASAKEMAEKYKINIVVNTKVDVIDTDKSEVKMGARVERYDKLVLATGSCSNKIPNINPIEGYLSINSMEDYEQLLKRLPTVRKVLIIGSGLVGVEFAHDLLSAGYKVSMVSQNQSALWPLLPSEIGMICRDHLSHMGLDWFVDPGVSGVNKVAEGVKVAFTNRECSVYDLVIAAVGIRPRIELAESIQLNTNRGIVTDKYGRTSVRNIFAIGDCAETYGLVLTYVAPIKQQAKAIAKSVLGELTAIEYPPMPVVVKMPTFPLSLVPVRQVNPQGNWEIISHSQEEGMVAAYHGQGGQLQGFALAGAANQQRGVWLKKMPDSIIDCNQKRDGH